jgi:hypothetical protein
MQDKSRINRWELPAVFFAPGVRISSIFSIFVPKTRLRFPSADHPQCIREYRSKDRQEVVVVNLNVKPI